MSNLKELKNKLCPNGVEFRKFRDTCIIKSGEFASPKELSKIQDDLHIYPCYGSNGLRGYINKFNYDGEYPIVGRVGACGSVNYINGKYFITDNAFIVKSKNNEYIPKFLYYLLISLNLNKYKAGGAQPAISGKTIYDLSAPIPPLEVQAEIVRILDIFTKDVNELIDLLKREQELRKKQYSYYLDKFTTIENSDIVKLKDVAIYRKERLKREFLTEDNYISVENLLKDRAGKIKSSNLPSVDSVIKYEKEDILIGNIRPYLKKIWFSDCIGGTNGDVLAISVTNKEKVYPKYLYYILSSDTFFSYDVKHSQCGKMPRGRKDMILEFTFKLPPLDTQKRIVDILDNLGRYTNDLQKGLPAEIEKRKKQYAYYRDELLKFERK